MSGKRIGRGHPAASNALSIRHREADPVGYTEAIVLGIVQGLTEFLPVSSSGHLALGHLLLNRTAESGKAFDILVHGATLLVIIGAFWPVFMETLRRNRRLLGWLALASVPTAVLGLFGRHEMMALGNSPLALAACFTLTGAFLWSEGRFAPRADGAPGGGRNLRELGWTDAVLVGLAQALALAPGVSRSGMTIAAGRLNGIAPDPAVAFSFLLGAPAIAGAIVIEAHAIGQEALAFPGPLAAGFGAALVSGILAVGLLKWIARSGKLSGFAPYCFLLAAGCLVLAAVKV